MKKSILDEEHGELMETLGEVSRKKTEAGRIFTEVLRIFSHHLDKENETIVPLLAYLKTRLGDYSEKDRDSLGRARAKLESSYVEMMREHEEMAGLIGLAQDSLKVIPDNLASNLAEHLLHHVQLEEELLYPAAFASGDLVEYELEHPEDKIKN